MADVGYVYIPEKNWWALRRKFDVAMPRGEVTASYLAGVLGISQDSAKNILPSLRAIGFVDDAGKTTDLANRWRNDAEYPKVCTEIREKVYPQEILDLFSDSTVDGIALRDWFKGKLRVGDVAARKLASFYQLLLDADPNKPSMKPANPGSITKPTKIRNAVTKDGTSRTRPPASIPHSDPIPNQGGTQHSEVDHLTQRTSKGGMSLHIDIQIHISPEASLDQIDKIFESMGKHLNLGKP